MNLIIFTRLQNRMYYNRFIHTKKINIKAYYSLNTDIGLILNEGHLNLQF